MFHNIAAVESELNRLDASQAVLCGLAGITPGSLSDILRGVKPASFQQEQDIYKWLEGLNKLIEAVKPLQLDLRKTLQIKEQIQLLEAGRLQVSVVVQEPREEKIEVFAIRFKSGSFFLRARQNYAEKLEILSSMNIGQAANFTGKELAEQALKSLEALGRTGSIVENKYPPSDDSWYFDLEMAGLKPVVRT